MKKVIAVGVLGLTSACSSVLTDTAPAGEPDKVYATGGVSAPFYYKPAIWVCSTKSGTSSQCERVTVNVKKK